MKLQSKTYKITKEELRKALKLGKEDFTITDLYTEDNTMNLTVYQEVEE